MFLRRCIVSVLFVGFVAKAPAQIRELWRVEMTNNSAQRVLTTVAVDDQNNTIVGATETFYGGPASYVAGSVQKLASDGRVLWEFREGKEAYNGVDGLAVDGDGNVFLSVQLSFSFPSPIVLIKLSPDGKELWRKSSLYAGSQTTTVPSSSVKLDSAGNVFFLISQFVPGTEGSKQSLAKLDTDGRSLWRCTLPGYQYFTDGGVAKTLTLTSDGGAVIVGGYSATPAALYFEGSGFAAKIRADGVLDWLNADYKGKQRTGIFNSVAVGSKGAICAASSYEGLTVFSANGKPLHTINSGSEAFGVTAKGDFLLTQFREKIYTLKESGAVGNWETYSGLFPVVSVLPDENDGLLVTGIWPGVYPGVLGIAKLNRGGNIVWRSFLPNVFFIFMDSSLRGHEKDACRARP